MDTISFEDFKKIDIRIGKIISAEKIENSTKLLKLLVDFGEANLPAGRQVLAGIAKYYKPEDLTGKLCPFVFNLEPKKLGELESQGMILAADNDGPVLMYPDKNVNPGSIVK